ncbi:homoserine dehydrogenase [Marininema halotolerans]|uniref:Homoserine dehydrogenase n=1 Tax=Marininema halotolerans TaxID=1155944 RepID=A0A1I6Q112_9BACL|nr:homoserine dehydrogenase [Marininema halotolerans]SFS46092.1 homoserine dehydrogenase [Marininema halotolerans]
MEKIGVGLLGLGTVGWGVYQAFHHRQQVITKKTNRLFEIRKVLVKDVERPRQNRDVFPLLTDDFSEVLDEEVQVIIEAIGGVEPARRYIEEAIMAGCHVVTANKELIAKHGVSLEQLAHRHGVKLLYEASVAGGIPILGTIRHLLQTNHIHRITGILNGTTNFLLTEMEKKGVSYEEGIAVAQELGYAEADPSNDVDGVDSMYKLAILTRLAFEVTLPFQKIPYKGIRGIKVGELILAKKLGYAVKLLAEVGRETNQDTVSLRVAPMLVPLSHPLATVEGVYNGVHIEADGVQDITLLGQGAGTEPTASVMLEDVCNLFLLPPPMVQDEPEAVILPEEPFGERFIYMEFVETIDEEVGQQMQTRLEKIGLPLIKMEAITLPEGGGVALLFEQWNPIYQGILLAEIGIEVKRMLDRPIYQQASNHAETQRFKKIG